MTVYSKPKTDEALLSEIGDSNSVLLVGCPICSNLSYCIQKKGKMPFSKFSLSGSKPLYVIDEVDRISTLLREKGIKVKEQVYNFPTSLCGLDEKTSKKLKLKAKGVPTIMTFSCDLGKEKMEGLFPNKEIVGVMNAIGIFGVPINRKFNKFYVDHDKVNIKRFQFSAN